MIESTQTNRSLPGEKQVATRPLQRGRLSTIRTLLVVATAAFTASASSPAAGVTIVIKGKDEPIHGYLVSESASEVVVREVSVNGTRVVKIPLSRVEFINRPVDDDRLSGLQPDRPEQYRQYAEELSEQRADPEARELATRLFLIAAHRQPDRLGRSCLLGMSNLATTVEQRDRCRALAYLLDPEHDRSLLEPRPVAVAKVSDATRANDENALESIVDKILRGRYARAADVAKRHEVQRMLAPYPRLLTPTELELILATPTNVELSPQLRARVLRLHHEMIVRKTPGGMSLTRDSGRKWSVALLNPDNQQPVRPLTLDTISPYDPDLSVYRDGEWRASE